ncbi:bifunctional enoyl-CoA hydratase/phosphate acetyltransferase [Methanobacterium spitsbergense]|uniref:Bifunctional enoyl-CoA hydratase/phosphate acetyltransferase n=1 Tax=Methanobacterium spitsbergense TaxID=2874285 RepID=A0A8T5UW37_9EURY|nr:bifunctional enoyl-CoA hydratase/phosphate acetyltransferase [Methanobacterium spitsbergense]MBZ2166116.1 bifunctional enoyl-CoA hydratase/phosphate acetyltransferase [Methanobacterium spitsbergense]
MITKFEEVFDKIKSHPKKQIAVAVAHDSTVLEAVTMAEELNITDYILVGDEQKILDISKNAGFEINENKIYNEPNNIKAVKKAVQLVKSNRADILMKGFVNTDDFLRGVLDRDNGLRTGKVMSHVYVLESSALKRLLFITDGSMNIYPDLETKCSIILNSIYLANIFEIEEPKVAITTAIELANPKMPSTIDAAVLAKMSQRGQFSGKIIDGPLALDNAISPWAAEHKGIGGPVAGKADIIVVPSIEAGNILCKAHVYLTGGNLAGVVIGAAAPIVLTSRADTSQSKLNSIATAVLTANMERTLSIKFGNVHY